MSASSYPLLLGRFVELECLWVGQLGFRRLRGDWLDEDWRNDDEQLGLVLLKPLALEQVSQDRDVAENGDLGLGLEERLVIQPRDGKALTIPELDLRLGATDDQRGDLESVQHDAVGKIESRNLRLHLQSDDSFTCNR